MNAHQFDTLRKVRFWIAFAISNLVVAGFTFLLIYENHRVWIVLTPILLIIAWVDVVLARRIVQRKTMASLGIPVGRLAGLIFAIIWTINSFTWWKCFLIALAALLLYESVHRRNRLMQAFHPPTV